MIKLSTFVTVVSTMWTFWGWIGATLSAALMLWGIWWVNR